MGKALEWLSEFERKNLALEWLPGAKAVKRQVVALCPFHVEKTASFGYDWAKDLFHCFGCGEGGDLIKLWARLRGPGDEVEAFKEFRDKYAPASAASPHRFSGPGRASAGGAGREIPAFAGMTEKGAGMTGEGTVNDQSALKLGVPGLTTEAAKPPAQVSGPGASSAGSSGNDQSALKLGVPGLTTEVPKGPWRERAGLFVEHSMERLKGRRRELERLARRGFAAEGPELCRLGWNDRLKVFPGAAWGIEGEMRLHVGLVIPLFEGGEVIKIKIRRPEGANGPRYLTIRGSRMKFSCYGSGRKIMVVESELDAAMLWSRFRDWSFVATGSASARPCAAVAARLAAAKVLAVSLDGDKAGAKAWRDYWREAFPRAFQWQLPQAWGAKDPGEAAGRDLSAWLREAVVYAYDFCKASK